MKNPILRLSQRIKQSPKLEMLGYGNGNIIALKGPPGVGKTSLIKHGLAKSLNLPFSFITLGGINDSSYFDGFSYTYEGSKCGKLCNVLIETGCMNPIIFMDELDKISNTDKGDEINNLLQTCLAILILDEEDSKENKNDNTNTPNFQRDHRNQFENHQCSHSSSSFDNVESSTDNPNHSTLLPKQKKTSPPMKNNSQTFVQIVQQQKLKHT